MKRSEMIELIERLLDSGASWSDKKTRSENLLCHLEEAGMLPPRLNEDYCQALMSIYYAGYTFHQWDEDIEKNEKVIKEYNRRLKRRAGKLK